MASAAAEFSLGSSRASMEHPIKAKAEGEIPIHIWSIAEQSSSTTTTLVLLFPDGLGNSLSHGNTILRLALQNTIFWCFTVKVFLLFSLLTLSFAKKIDFCSSGSVSLYK